MNRNYKKGMCQISNIAFCTDNACKHYNSYNKCLYALFNQVEHDYMILPN